MNVEDEGCGKEYFTKEGYKICSGIDRKWGIFLLCPKCMKKLSAFNSSTSTGGKK